MESTGVSNPMLDMESANMKFLEPMVISKTPDGIPHLVV